MTRRPCRPVFLSTLIALFVFSGCSRHPASRCTPADVREFFVNPQSTAFAAMARHCADSVLFDTRLRVPSDSAPAGDRRLRLTDSTGAVYGLGYRTPAAIRSDTSYPLIIYLHGGTGSQRIDKGDSAFLMLEALADTFDLFLASPSANRSTPWWGPAGLSRILQTLRFMTLHYPINPDKVFLAGVSDGATGCYAAANTINAPFAGFMAVSGFGGMLPSLGMTLVPANLMHRPIYNVNAGQDHIYPIGQVSRFTSALKQQGIRIIEQVYPDEAHGFDYRAREMGSLADLVRTWSRPHSSAVAWTFIPGFPNLPDHIIDWRFSEGDAFIRTWWSNDTLVVRSQGLSSFTLPLAATSPGEKIACCFPALQNRTRMVSPLKSTRPLTLLLMINRCFPESPPTWYYRIAP
ncbi:MAG: dienelactone hydrolase family protein [Chitinispirillaceae bacterium]|nr:dienelactone hydrolase family protein [Chitinispirillaceae bacterium]